MSTPRFKKAKGWIGKDLTIHIGGGDKKIRDTDVLEGAEWARFVGMGFLVQIDAKPAAQAVAVAPRPVVVQTAAPALAVTPAVVAEATPVAPGAARDDEGSTTKSSAGKIDMGTGKVRGKPGPKPKNKSVAEPENDGATPVVPAETAPAAPVAETTPAPAEASDDADRAEADPDSDI